MIISGWLSGQLGKKHLQLAKLLNVDRNVANDIWKHFLQHYNEYFEGDPSHWLGCCFYLKYPFSPGMLTTNRPISLNLTSLLRFSNLSLIDFFQKTKKWAEVCGMGEEDLVKFENLQRGFSVSMVAFKNFRSLFSDMFIDPGSTDSSKHAKLKKAKSQPPSTKKLFDFTWILYISVKSSFPEVRDDLVHSYHLLLAACDFVFANAFLGGRKDVINPNFPDCKNSTTGGRYCNNGDIPCVIDLLCQRHNGVSIQAKQVKEYFWKKQIKSFFEKKYLKGNPELMTDVIESNNFDINMFKIDKFYDEYILNLGLFDERLFLASSFFPELSGSQEKLDDVCVQLEGRNKVSPLQMLTPLSARRFLKGSDGSESPSNAPLVSSFSSMSTLQSMLFGRASGPSPYLQQLLKNSKDINPSIETRVSDMAQIVFAHFTEPTNDFTPWPEDLAQSRVDISRKLYYRLLDKLIMREMENSQFDCRTLLVQDIFHKTLFACAVELVIFTYRSPWVFPWVLETLHISAYHFSRIIEVVVRADDLLCREMIKHLNWVEEVVLERLAWRSDSPLWRAVVDSSLPIPSCEDVSVQRSPQASQESGIGMDCSQEDCLASLAGHPGVLTDSPGMTLLDKFQSPVSPSLKRPAESSASHKIIILNNGMAVPIKKEKEERRSEKPRRTGAIALFFRKFYYLSSVRLQDMCDQLGLTDLTLRQKIWTSFELTVINHLNLMIDRHLDQIIMCSIYVICKIVGPEQKFTNMMKCYRNQPQAQSRVYRKVILGPELTIEDLMKPSDAKRSLRETGDLIQFYNIIFVNKVEDLVRRFKTTNSEGRIILSPIPYNSSLSLQSPRRKVSDTHSIFIRHLSEKSPVSSTAHITYLFTKSPVKNLKALNSEMSDGALDKRLLSEDDSENSDFVTSKAAVNKKVSDLFSDRMAAKFLPKE